MDEEGPAGIVDPGGLSEAAPPAADAPQVPGDTPGALAAGTRISGYRIEKMVGRGGMATVYLALDERLGRQVALKLMAPELAADESFRLRFIRESRAAAAVNDPHIIPVFEAGSTDRWLFIAMRYVPSDVRSLLASGPLPPARAAGIISQVAGALDAAHAAGLRHRDIKPSNMLIDARSGQPDHVYLTDFGLSITTMEPSRLTASGTFLGTVHYVAPEQIQGTEVGDRADQYSLACAAFEMLSGAPPFSRGETLAVLWAQISAPPPSLASTRPGLTRHVDEVLGRALAKDPADRYSSCGQFAAKLTAALARPAPPGATAEPAAAQPEPGPYSNLAPSGGGQDVAGPSREDTAGPFPAGAALPPPPPFTGPVPVPSPPLTSSIPLPAASWPPVYAPPPADSWAQGPASGPAALWAPSPDLSTDAMNRVMTLPLRSSFRYVHEPFGVGEDALPSLGNDGLTDELQSRILHSRGGTFLITGFRGVGKSTLVQRALQQITADAESGDLVVPISLSIARSTSTERLLMAVVRRVFETLSDSGVLGRLPAQTQHALSLAYTRTSLSFKETKSEGWEQNAGLAVPKISLSGKRSHSLATEAAFLAYSETDVEYDLMRIVSLVDSRQAVQPRFWLRRLLTRPGQALPRLHLVIVLDEVDKLTAGGVGISAVEDLLGGIKNVLTMSGAHFLIVAGPDMHDQVVRDTARGNGVYESIFGWRLYVPCIWKAPERLIADVVQPGTQADRDTVELLTRYLRFKARGVPRRLLQEFNSFVVWDGKSPSLRITAWDLERVKFYARLEYVVSSYFESTGQRRWFPVPIDEDRWQLAGYYVIDWVLQSAGEPFTAAELLAEADGEDARFDPLLRVSASNVEQLLAHLAEHQVVDVVREMNAAATIIGGIAGSGSTVYRLSEQVRRTLYGFAARHELERAVHDVSLVVDGPGGLGVTTARARPAQRIIGGRYVLSELIGQDSMSSVYKGQNQSTGQPVIVKILRSDLAADDTAISRFRRAADIMRELKHENIAETYDVLQDPGGEWATVMQWLKGPSLDRLITDDGPMPAQEAVAIGRILAATLDYLSGNQIVRLGLKPGNIIMSGRKPVIIDLSTALRMDATAARITEVGELVGTPAFMAPELIEGSSPDPRVDIYSLGLVLYYCVAGQTPWEGLSGPAAIISAILHEQIDLSSLPISAEFRRILERALARNRNDRFATGAEFSIALTDTPEWRTVRPGTSGSDDGDSIFMTQQVRRPPMPPDP